MIPKLEVFIEKSAVFMVNYSNDTVILKWWYVCFHELQNLLG